MKYLADTNIFIEAKNGYYAFDICPGFWTWLKGFDDMRSISMVKDEILDGNDDLSEWASNELPDDYFINEDTTVQQRFREIGKYVNSIDKYEQHAKDEFLGCADGWLLAAASVKDAIVVTHEKYDSNCKRKIPLPNIAEKYKVDCLRITDVLRREKVAFR